MTWKKCEGCGGEYQTVTESCNTPDCNWQQYDDTNQKIKIPLSEEDLQQLLNNETFDWCFDGVDVHLFKCEDGEVKNG